MLAKILLAIVAVVLAFSLYVSTRPGEFTVLRTTRIAAGPQLVYSQISDFHQWPAWSPWAKLDPAMKTNYEGAPNGVGAIYGWSGNDKVGEGRMTITNARAPTLVQIKLEFLKPFSFTNEATFTLVPDGTNTIATWAMSGTQNFVQKAFSLFMNMDKMVGGDFEKGLAQLKAVAEDAAVKTLAPAPGAAGSTPAPIATDSRTAPAAQR